MSDLVDRVAAIIQPEPFEKTARGLGMFDADAEQKLEAWRDKIRTKARAIIDLIQNGPSMPPAVYIKDNEFIRFEP